MAVPFKPTYLYVKTYLITGLKYFGKTVKTDPIKYKGSGKHWLNHLKKHGNFVATEIIGLFTDEKECKDFALLFSETNKIVKSKEWANLIPEDGITGWGTGISNPAHNMTPEQNKKKGDHCRGKKKPEISKMFSGSGNPMFGRNDQTYGIVKKSKGNLGKTYEQIFGNEKAKIIKDQMSLKRTGQKHNLKELCCPHCFLIGSGPNMTRYYFDKCNLNDLNPNNKIGQFSILKDDYFDLLISGVKYPKLSFKGKRNGRYKHGRCVK